MKLLYNCW